MRINLALTEADERRFRQYLRFDPATGCTIWVGARTRSGYGQFNLRGTVVYAHRIAFVIGGGILDDSKPFVIHECDNPACCEFAHLRAGTPLDNSTDMAAKGRAHKGKKGLPPGVYQTKNGRFKAGWYRNGIASNLGTYDSIDEALEVIRKAKSGLIAANDPTPFTRNTHPKTKVNSERFELMLQLVALNEWPRREIAKAFGIGGAHLSNLAVEAGIPRIRNSVKHCHVVAKEVAP